MIPLVADPQEVGADWLTQALRADGRANHGQVTSLRRELVGTGQMGCNVRFHLEWDGAPPDAPRTVIGKFPSADPTSRATGALQGVYRKEVEFYRQIAATVDIRVPRCFLALVDATGGEFVLLLEDVAPARQGDQLRGCGVDVAALALEELVKLHAPRWDDPALAQLDFLDGPSAERSKLLGVLYASLWPGFEARYGERLAPDVMALGARLGPALEAWSLALRSPLTVTHGDYRLDNMLFRPSGDASPLVVVDWQTVGRGVGTSDAAYFLGAGLPVDLRRAHERELLRGYWEGLEAVGISGYTWEQCWYDYRHATFGGVVMAVIASMIVQQTERGDEMFVTMASRHGRHALDLEAERLLG